MSNDLEKYLQQSREDLDVESPDDQAIWEGIRNELGTSEARREKKRILITLRNIAAVAIIVLSLGYIAFDVIGDRRFNRISLATIDDELGERENEYKTLVNMKLEEAGSFNEIDNIIINELFEEIQKLDTIYEQSMKDLKELGYNEKVINTIFDTYERKIYLLELIILENNKIRKYETDENIFL